MTAGGVAAWVENRDFDDIPFFVRLLTRQRGIHPVPEVVCRDGRYWFSCCLGDTG
jgi:hypothetical protein